LKEEKDEKRRRKVEEIKRSLEDQVEKELEKSRG